MPSQQQDMHIRKIGEKIMKFEKLVIHPVEDWSMARMVIVSSTEYPELGILAWGEDHKGGGTEIQLRVPGVKKPFKTRMICGGCDPYLKDYKDILYNEAPDSRINKFLQAIRETCQKNGINTLIFQKWNKLQQVVYPGIELEQDVDGVHFHHVIADDLDRTRIEQAFAELGGVEFRMEFFQSYYEKRDQIRAAKNAVARVQENKLKWLEVKHVVTSVHDALNQTPVSIDELEPSEDKHSHSCRWPVWNSKNY